jgi:hypothetical protein
LHKQASITVKRPKPKGNLRLELSIKRFSAFDMLIGNLIATLIVFGAYWLLTRQ